MDPVQAQVDAYNARTGEEPREVLVAYGVTDGLISRVLMLA